MTGILNAPYVSRYSDFLLTKGFWGGVAMAAPFYAEFFSWYLVVVLFAPLFFFVVFHRDAKIAKPHLAIAPMVILLLLHLVALIYSDTNFEYQVIKDVIIASLLLVIYFLADDDVSDGFFVALIPLALVSALFGLVKAALLDRGYVIGFVLEGCSSYPAGSSLCVNYNNLGLLWLVASLGCLRNRLWVVLPILIAAGALSSSRRFIVLMVFLPFVWVLMCGKSALLKSALVAVLAASVIYLGTDPDQFERFQSEKKPYKVIFDFREPSTDNKNISTNDKGLSADGAEISTWINRSTPSVMLGTMDDGTLGTASRLSYWRLAFHNLGWLPQGWSYHKLFSCSFSPCSDFHYPHMPVMSEWIIGGVLFGLVAVAFYAWPVWLVWRRRSILHISLFVFAMPYSLMSGDTVFSLPICIACFLVALSSVPRSIRGVP